MLTYLLIVAAELLALESAQTKPLHERTNKLRKNGVLTKKIFFHTVKAIGWEIKICQNGKYKKVRLRQYIDDMSVC